MAAETFCFIFCLILHLASLVVFIQHFASQSRCLQMIFALLLQFFSSLLGVMAEHSLGAFDRCDPAASPARSEICIQVQCYTWELPIHTS